MVTHPVAQGDILEAFTAPTAAWFRASFATPTSAQQGAWEAISSGQHTLVVAPTGSGKTLAAFLWALDRLSTASARAAAAESPQTRTRVLYVSPMKALAVDVERNLRSPLVGISHAARRLGVDPVDLTVGVRSGDTTSRERRLLAKTPPDVLITTPESLFLMLTSAARETLRGIDTVIIDEIHAVAGTKRGAHLALSLERLDALLEQPAQRVGLSATVRPIEEVARFLSGGRQAAIVQPPSAKTWDLKVVVPVPDLAELGQVTDDLSGAAAGDPRRTSIWPHVEERIVDLVMEHRSTLIFANSRRLAERLTARLNEIYEDRLTGSAIPDEKDGAAETGRAVTARPPAEIMASGGARGAPPELARAHHGSVSKDQRAAIEDDLKAGRLPAVVATSSLELGIDMGAIDLVVQVESPPSVASGLQRVGRAGHQVGAVSSGVVFPKYRGDLIQTAVVIDRMREGAIEALSVPANPLDVLAQQVVAMCALDQWRVDDLLTLVRRAAPYQTLTRTILDPVLDMLSGLYPSDEFAELRPRIVWDRVSDTLTGRPGAQRLAVTSGGTIPDRGLYGVFLAGEGAGRRVGELDEEMVYESRVGDVFTLGTTSWRIEDITHDQVLVTPAPGLPGRLPFWKGDTLGRPAELGAAVGRFLRELSATSEKEARARLLTGGLDDWACDNVLSYLADQRAATRALPDDRTIVIERFRDELGDWRIAIHTPYGSAVHAPWALCVGAKLQERFGIDVQAMHADDGIVLRLPDVELSDEELRADLAGLVVLDPEEVTSMVTAQIGGSALFASRFRECAARALLLPRRRPDRRQALWQQRQRSAQLLSVASRYPAFPIVLEAVRECVQDVFDVPSLVSLMRSVAAREVGVVAVDTPSPSPFARSLLFGYVAQYLYEGDSPLAERRAAALALDPTLLAELLGGDGAASLADLLDPDVVGRTENELQRLAADRQARHAEDVADLVRRLGPMTSADVIARSAAPATEVQAWLVELADQRRIVDVRVNAEPRWIAVEDIGRLRDALGTAVPVGVPAAFLEPVPDPLGDLAARFARARGPFGAADLAAWLGTGRAVATGVLDRLVSEGRLSRGELRPPQLRSLDDAGFPDYCDAEVLRLLRRRSLAALRSQVEPVTQGDYARFLPAWLGVGTREQGPDAVLRVVEQLAGALLPASALETLILPARLPAYHPAWLDELMTSGDILWQGHGRLPGDDGWISLHVGDLAHLTLHEPEAELTEAQRELLEAMTAGGAYFFRTLGQLTNSTDDASLAELVWDLTWSGHVSNDTLTPLRILTQGRGAHRTRSAARARRLVSRGGGLSAMRAASRPAMPSRGGPPQMAGRWSRLPIVATDATTRRLAAAEILLERYGVLTRGSVGAEDVPGGFASVYQVLSAAEETGRVRRGYFIDGLGATQFSTAGAVDRLRAGTRSPASASPDEPTGALLLASTDPANPYGAALPWPEPADHAETGHRPARKAGALVVMVDGELIYYLEKGGRSLLSWHDDPTTLDQAATALTDAVRRGALRSLTVRTIDGSAALGSDHAVAHALERAGFHATPQGLRVRSARR